MPRDSNGVYSLPAGNPVVTLTTITTTWANTTLADISTALTNSLDRAGSGGMTGQLKLANGTIGSPALTWGTEPTSGLYRAGAGDFRFSVGSNDKLQITAAGVTFAAAQGLFADGTAAAPSIAFTTDPDTGMYKGGANEVDFSAGGVLKFTIGATAVLSGVTHRFQDGAVATPSITFDADLNTGIYRNAGDSMRFSAGGVDAAQISSGGSYWLDGTAGAPSISFLNDTNTGIFRTIADQMEFSTAGVSRVQINTANVATNLPIRGADGSAAAPQFSFFNDTGLGIFRNGSNNLGFTTAGVMRANVDSAGLLLYGGVEVGYRGMNTVTNVGGSFTLTNAHNGRVVDLSNAGGAVTLTLPVLAANTAIGILNKQTAGNITVTRSSTSLFSVGFGDANRTIAPLGMCTLWTVDGTTWFLSGSGVS